MTNGVATYTGCRYTVASATAYTLTASSAGLASATATTTVVAGHGDQARLHDRAARRDDGRHDRSRVVVAEQDAFGNTETGDSSTPLSLGGQQRRRRVQLHDHARPT